MEANKNKKKIWSRIDYLICRTNLFCRDPVRRTLTLNPSSPPSQTCPYSSHFGVCSRRLFLRHISWSRRSFGRVCLDCCQQQIS